MPERPIRGPEIPLRTLGGLNERPSKANLQTGECDILQGLYPKDIGLWARVPGKTYVATAGTGPVRAIWNTVNVNGDVIVQSGSALYVYTLDEIQGRSFTPSLVFAPIVEEESMSQAIIVQLEAAGTKGGSADGKQTASSTAAANTFYGRRLTDMLVNESSTVTAFTASTGGGSGTSTEGTFSLAVGTYRITINATYSPNGTNGNIVAGLYNVTSSAFEVYSGTSTPVMLTSDYSGTAQLTNIPMSVKAKITVSSTTKTFSIRHQGTPSIVVQDPAFCGQASTASATINGSAPKNLYCWIEILKVS